MMNKEEITTVSSEFGINSIHYNNIVQEKDCLYSSVSNKVNSLINKRSTIVKSNPSKIKFDLKSKKIKLLKPSILAFKNQKFNKLTSKLKPVQEYTDDFKVNTIITDSKVESTKILENNSEAFSEKEDLDVSSILDKESQNQKFPYFITNQVDLDNIKFSLLTKNSNDLNLPNKINNFSNLLHNISDNFNSEKEIQFNGNIINNNSKDISGKKINDNFRTDISKNKTQKMFQNSLMSFGDDVFVQNLEVNLPSISISSTTTLPQEYTAYQNFYSDCQATTNISGPFYDSHENITYPLESTGYNIPLIHPSNPVFPNLNSTFFQLPNSYPDYFNYTNYPCYYNESPSNNYLNTEQYKESLLSDILSVNTNTSEHNSDNSCQSNSSNQFSESFLNKENSKCKLKMKANESLIISGAEVNQVFVWDLDETLIIFHSLLTGSFAQKNSKDSQFLLSLGLRMEDMIFYLADNHFFFNDLEQCDQVQIEDLMADDDGRDLTNYNFLCDGFSSTSPSNGLLGMAGKTNSDWMKKLSYRYRRIKEVFMQHKSSLSILLGSTRYEQWLNVRSQIESQTDNWLDIAIKSLKIINSRNHCANILVTTTQLVPALAKLILNNLGDLFDIHNIYSATKIGKENCFDRIKARFGKKCTFVVIGDGNDEETAAKQLLWPFWRISSNSDLTALLKALELGYL